MNLFLERSAHAGFIVDLDGTILESNSAWQKLGYQFNNFFNGLAASVVQEILHNLEGCRSLIFVGTRFNCYWQHQHNQILVINEISGQDPYKLNMSEQHELLKIATRTAGVAYWDWNPQTLDLGFDQNWFLSLGIDLSNRDPQQVRQLIHPEDLALAQEHYRDHLQGQLPNIEAVMRFRTIYGNYRHIFARGKIVRWNDEGQPVKVCGVHVDLTETMGLKEELELKRMQLVQSTKMATLGEMAGNIAHEINTPLAVILGSTELLLEGLDAEQQAKQLNTIQQTTLKISSTVKSLRNFSDADKKETKTQRSIKETLEQAVDLCEESIRQQQIELIVDVPECQLLINHKQVVQVILNLLRNAKEAAQVMVGPRWIKVLGQEISTGYELRVLDSGGGVDPLVQKDLMQAFVSAKSPQEHAGIGLSVAKALMEAQGGQLHWDAHSEHTCFILKFKYHER